MAKKSKNRWEPSFNETLKQKKEKEDAEYLARVQARTDGIKRTLTGQHRKDQYNRIIREFDDPEKRAEIQVIRHKERIEFLENVLRENQQWRERQDEPLQLKPDLVALQAKIIEMKEYVAGRFKSGVAAAAGPVEKPVAKPPEFTPEQISAVYGMAQERILLAYGGILGRLARNVRKGLPVERARERLMALGISKHVVDAFNEVATGYGYRFSENEKKSLKLFLLHPDRLGVFLDGIIKNARE